MADAENRPWDSDTIVAESPTHKIKRIDVGPRRRLSYQRHRHRSEHWPDPSRRRSAAATSSP
jgi:mannose-6-phosphate isomerase